MSLGQAVTDLHAEDRGDDRGKTFQESAPTSRAGPPGSPPCCGGRAGSQFVFQYCLTWPKCLDVKVAVLIEEEESVTK